MNTITRTKKDKTQTPIIKAGQLWENLEGEIYLLARVSENTWQLVDLAEGNRWSTPCSNIAEVFSGQFHEFALIKNETITIKTP